MYENQTAEAILARMLANPNLNGLDKRPSSVIYNALAPAAAELAQTYIAIDNLRDLTFAGTSEGEYLDRRVAELGIIRNAATFSMVRGVFKNGSGALMAIPIGSRFSSGLISYVATEFMSAGNYKLQAEKAGEQGNESSGTLMPLASINGLADAQITELLIPGEDDETDDDLITKYFATISDRFQDGNVAQYQKWADDYEGIGKSKIIPLWDGADTVKVSILNSQGQPASTELVEEFQAYLDPGSTGLGNGMAPIGAIVTVTTASRLDLVVAANITPKTGYTTADGVQAAIESYLASAAYEVSSLSYLRIAAVIVDSPSIAEVSNLTINGGTVDIAIPTEHTPVLQTLSLVVV